MGMREEQNQQGFRNQSTSVMRVPKKHRRKYIPHQGRLPGAACPRSVGKRKGLEKTALLSPQMVRLRWRFCCYKFFSPLPVP